MNKIYVPIIKTGEAEIRAIENSPFLSEENDIIPLIELTRGRQKTKKLDNGKKLITHPFTKRLNSLKERFKDKTVAIDLTSEEGLLSGEILDLYEPSNGYEKWRSFLNSTFKEGIFKSIIPSIILNWDDNEEDFVSNVNEEVKKICANYGAILYRCSLKEKDCYEELPLILSSALENTEIYIVIDAGYLQEAMEESAIEVFNSRIKNLKGILKGKKYHMIISSTSFPNNVTEYGDKPTATIREIEKSIYCRVSKEHHDIIYSDYATINPIRNDLITMARGWIPRIDVPITDAIYYYRQRRPKGMTAYKGAYTYAAGRAMSDKRFPKALHGLWGISMIESCAFGEVPSSAPNFWISVRMNIHIYQTLRWLETLGDLR